MCSYLPVYLSTRGKYGGNHSGQSGKMNLRTNRSSTPMQPPVRLIILIFLISYTTLISLACSYILSYVWMEAQDRLEIIGSCMECWGVSSCPDNMVWATRSQITTLSLVKGSYNRFDIVPGQEGNHT